MSDDSLLGASSRRLNPNSAQIYREDKGKKVINEMFRMSSEVQRVNYQGFGHIFINCTSKILVIQKHKDTDEKKNYCVQVYEINPEEDFSNLDEEDVQDKGINTMSPIESDNEVNKEYNNSVLVVEEEGLENYLVESSKEVNMVLEKSHDISPLKPPNSPLTMLDVQRIKSLEQHAPHSLMLDAQCIIGLEQRVEFSDPLPLTRDKKDEDNHNLLGCVQTISTTTSNSVCSTHHPQSYNV